MAPNIRASADWYRRYLRDFATSAVAGRKHHLTFDEVSTYVMFVGHARSGSTLVGSLLNAHPDAVLAHELDALRYVKTGLGRNQLYQLIIESDRRFTAERASLTKQNYSFGVPGMWQGRHRHLRVVGDKHAGTATRELRARPELLDKLNEVTGVPIRLVHVVRNPWDNIATIARRSERSPEVATATYFRRCETIQKLKATADGNRLSLQSVHHEALIGDATTTLAGVCAFVGLDPQADYLAACASIVNESANASRHSATWPAGLVDHIAHQAKDYDFLADYSFDR